MPAGIAIGARNRDTGNSLGSMSTRRVVGDWAH